MNSFEISKNVFIFILLLKVIASIGVSEAKEVSCEWFSTQTFGGPVGVVKTCWMVTTPIDEPGTTISPRDEAVGGFYVSYNQNIFHLPDNVSGTFPNFESYIASFCSVKEISKRNFNGLVKLKYLDLHSNEIEMVASDTFEDLKDLEELYLYFNKIKSMNGKAFQGLNKLKEVWLNSNVCINEDFETPTQIAALQGTVNEKCAFQEQEVITTTTIGPLEAQIALLKENDEKSKREIESLKLQLKASKAETLQATKTFEQTLKTEVSTKLQEIQELQAKKQQCKQQLDSIQELNKELKLQWNSTCTAETKELRMILEDINELIQTLQQKEAEINDKKEEVEKLKKRIEQLEEIDNRV